MGNIEKRQDKKTESERGRKKKERGRGGERTQTVSLEEVVKCCSDQ